MSKSTPAVTFDPVLSVFRVGEVTFPNGHAAIAYLAAHGVEDPTAAVRAAQADAAPSRPEVDA